MTVRLTPPPATPKQPAHSNILLLLPFLNTPLIFLEDGIFYSLKEECHKRQ